MAAGLIGSDDYTAAFHWGEAVERDGTAKSVAAAVATELDQQNVTLDWRATVESLRNEGA